MRARKQYPLIIKAGTRLAKLAEMIKEETDSCIEWPYGRAGSGPVLYGVLYVGGGHFGRQDYTHRTAWRMANDVDVPEGLMVMHSCDNPPCVNPRHLSVGTGVDNMQDASRKKRTKSGSENGAAKLTEDQVLRIRAVYKSGIAGCGQQALGRRFGVHRIAIRKIIKREMWKNI